MASGGVLTFTLPRGPIAAQYKSPGPCYQLPGIIGKNDHDPRSVHHKGPAYPFGIRHGKFRDDCSPGPCYLPNSKIFRDGMDGTPHYSLYSRQQELRGFRPPGPGAYKPESAGPQSKYSAPCYSFGTRHRNRKTDNSPAPNVYTIQSTVGKTTLSRNPQAPCYSLTGRSKTGSFHEDLQKTPGPGSYNTTEPSIYKDKCPQYSMTSRNVMPGDGTQKPGPGAHSPEKTFPSKRKAPQYSFGIRHSEYTAPLIVDATE